MALARAPTLSPSCRRAYKPRLTPSSVNAKESRRLVGTDGPRALLCLAANPHRRTGPVACPLSTPTRCCLPEGCGYPRAWGVSGLPQKLGQGHHPLDQHQEHRPRGGSCQARHSVRAVPQRRSHLAYARSSLVRSTSGCAGCWAGKPSLAGLSHLGPERPQWTAATSVTDTRSRPNQRCQPRRLAARYRGSRVTMCARLARAACGGWPGCRLSEDRKTHTQNAMALCDSGVVRLGVRIALTSRGPEAVRPSLPTHTTGSSCGGDAAERRWHRCVENARKGSFAHAERHLPLERSGPGVLFRSG